MKARKMFNGLVVLALLLPLLLTGDPASTRAAEPLGALNGTESAEAHLNAPLNEKGSTATATEPSAVQADTENVELVGHIGGATNEAFVQGNYTYIGKGPRLTILNISDPTHPTEVGYYGTPGYARDVHVSGNTAFVADGSGGLPGVQYTGTGLFSLSGHIHDSSDHSIPNVNVSAGAGYSATTDASGVYTITGLVTGTYTITPTAESSAKNGWTFEPPTRTVSVPPDATGQDFTILPGPISTTLKMSGTASIATRLIYTDTQGLTTTLDFPAGSVPQTTTIILTPTLATGETGFAFACHAFELEAYQDGSLQSGLIFSTPVTVTIHYSDDDVRAVTGESELALWWWTGSEWRDVAQTCDPASTYTRDATNNMLKVPICHLSLFGLFGPGSSHRIYLPLVLRNYEPLRADFTATPTTGTVPLTVTFTNESSGVYTSSLWDFGDGSTSSPQVGSTVSNATLTTSGFTSTLENPTHVYTTTGAYTVTLTISGTGGTDTLARPNYITVSTPITGLRYVAPSGVDTDNDCTASADPCASVQHAVDVSAPGDEIRVASGTYIDLHVRPRNDVTTTGVVTQVVYVSKTVSIRGGYTTTNWTTPDPGVNTTTLDAQGQGRGLYVTGNPSTSSGQAISVAVEGLHITGGDSTGLGGPYSLWNDGGGAYVISATVTFRNNRVFDNIGDNAGGGLHLRSAHAVFSGNSVLSNTARYNGGGIFLWSGQATLTENTISNNAIGDFGGDLLTRSPYAPLGGGAVCGGGIFLGGETTLTDNTITGNTADWDGGGVCSYYDDSTLKDNLIADNTAGRRGGGMYVTDDVTMTGNIITGNTADGDGGGLALSGGSYAEPADVLLTNNVVANNQTSGDGSGVYVVGPANLVHTTIVSNSGGSGVHVARYAKGAVALTNTILVSHSVGISVTEDNTVTVNGVLWYETPITLSQAATTTVTVQNQYTGDPAFAPDGYHLMADSAAIDRGVGTDVTTDVDGDSRPQGADPDLGADEYVAEARMRRNRSALLFALLSLPQHP